MCERDVGRTESKTNSRAARNPLTGSQIACQIEQALDQNAPRAPPLGPQSARPRTPPAPAATQGGLQADARPASPSVGSWPALAAPSIIAAVWGGMRSAGFPSTTSRRSSASTSARPRPSCIRSRPLLRAPAWPTSSRRRGIREGSRRWRLGWMPPKEEAEPRRRGEVACRGAATVLNRPRKVRGWSGSVRGGGGRRWWDWGGGGVGDEKPFYTR